MHRPASPRITILAPLLALSALIVMSGCAQLKKNVSQPHPMEHQFGHLMFNGSALNRFPTLKPAAPTKAKTPANKAKAAQVAKKTAPGTAPRAAKAGPEPTVVARAEHPKGDDALPTVPAKPRGPKPTKDRGLDITEVPEPAQPAPPKTPGLGDGSMRGEILAAAKRLVGVRDNFDERGFITHLLQVADYSLQVKSQQDIVKALYDHMAAGKGIFGAAQVPTAGDLVFFHNTYDRDKDNRADDWFTMVGVVESVAADHTVTFIGFARGGVRRMYLNTDRPSIRRNEASKQTLNTIVRAKQMTDRPFTSYLAGELFASYGRLELVVGGRQTASK